MWQAVCDVIQKEFDLTTQDGNQYQRVIKVAYECFRTAGPLVFDADASHDSRISPNLKLCDNMDDVFLPEGDPFPDV